MLPLIAAMLILISAGAALTELLGAQRMRTVTSVQSAQAYWSADAGAWHSAQTGAGISTAVDFGGSTYTVTKNGDVFTSTATQNGTTRSVIATLESPEEDEDEEVVVETGLIDEAASAATAYQNGNDHFYIDLVSVASSDLEIEFIELSSDGSTPKLEEVELASSKILTHKNEALPTGVVSLNAGNGSERTIVAGDDPEARITFRKNFDPGTYQFTLVLYFMDGSSDSVGFSITW